MSTKIEYEMGKTQGKEKHFFKSMLNLHQNCHLHKMELNF